MITADGTVQVELVHKEDIASCCHSFQTDRGRCFDCPDAMLRADDDDDDWGDDDEE